MEIQFIDDIDGTPADETIRFGIGGANYEVDLSAAHAQQLRKAVQPFIEAARRASSRRAASPRRAGGPSPAAVREWAKSEGIKVSDRGRVPAELIVKFQTASTQ
jgi:hypothetical protein